MAEHIREILMQEQEHQIDLATALGEMRRFIRSNPVTADPADEHEGLR